MTAVKRSGARHRTPPTAPGHCELMPSAPVCVCVRYKSSQFPCLQSEANTQRWPCLMCTQTDSASFSYSPLTSDKNQSHFVLQFLGWGCVLVSADMFCNYCDLWMLNYSEKNPRTNCCTLEDKCMQSVALLSPFTVTSNPSNSAAEALSVKDSDVTLCIMWFIYLFSTF